MRLLWRGSGNPRRLKSAAVRSRQLASHSSQSSADPTPRPASPPTGLDSFQEILNRARAQTLPYLDADAEAASVLPVGVGQQEEDFGDDVWPLPEHRDDDEDESLSKEDDDGEFGWGATRES